MLSVIDIDGSVLLNGAFPLLDSDSETDECTDIGGKMGTVPIGIGLCTYKGLGVGSVETVLHITIETISIGLGLGLCIGIGLGQWKHTISCHKIPNYSVMTSLICYPDQSSHFCMHRECGTIVPENFIFKPTSYVH